MIADVSPARQRLVVFATTIALLAVPGATRQHLQAHDLERTEVALTFASDTTFTLDVTNDPDWLLLRLEPFAAEIGIAGPRPDTAVRPLSVAERDAVLAAFAPAVIDRVVLWVDGREIRPTSAEFIAPRPQATDDGRSPPATYRLRGTMPREARSLRWFYGLVIDPYPLTVRRADGRELKETVLGNAWSESLDLAAQFQRPAIRDIAARYFKLGLQYVASAGVVHLLFVIGLMLPKVRLRPLMVGLGIFVLGQVLGLAATIGSGSQIAPRLMAPIVMLSIAYVVVESFLTAKSTPSRLAIAFVFGLIHGAQQAGALVSLVTGAMLAPSLAFMAAVVAVQVALARGTVSAIRLIARHTTYESTATVFPNS